ncbi:MAG: ribose ABC transporter permease [Spirochaetae bacterium HGW-Spirochaetae-4]|nr:MAG: ribose ABC transporter permease [Spirochaetae bacterium HGW-Spirochaetae-4]
MKDKAMQVGRMSLDSVKKFRFSVVNTQVTLVLALVILGVVFSTLSPVFFSVRNFLNVGISSSILGIMATGLTVAMLLGGLDISQYSVAAFAGLLTAVLLKAGSSIPVALLAVLACGVVLGGINGLIITRMRINPIITTLGTSLIFRSLAFIMTSGRYIAIDNEVMNYIGRGYFLGVPNAIWFMIFVYAIFYYMLKYTAFGRKIYAVGGNADASFLSGINVKKIRFQAFMISGIMAALAGLMMSAQVSAGMPTAGEGAELDVIVAVILGGISLSGGKGKILGTLLGVLILAVLKNGLTLLSVQAFYQMLIRGLVLILAVFLDTLRGGGYR